MSKFCFLSNPIKIGDDYGFDLYCTLFSNNEGYLIPNSSFMIQIKSNQKPIDLSKYNQDKSKIASLIPMFKELTVPYYVGVANKTTNCLDIYTGYIFPFYLTSGPDFPQKGIESNIILDDMKFSDVKKFEELYSIDEKKKKLTWKFPKLCSYGANEVHHDISSFMEHNKRFLENILTRHMQEYTFYEPDGTPILAIGNGTMSVFYRNFIRRSNELLGSILEMDKHLIGYEQENPEINSIFKDLIENLDRLVEHPIKYTNREQLQKDQISSLIEPKKDLEMSKELIKLIKKTKTWTE